MNKTRKFSRKLMAILMAFVMMFALAIPVAAAEAGDLPVAQIVCCVDVEGDIAQPMSTWCNPCFPPSGHWVYVFTGMVYIGNGIYVMGFARCHFVLTCFGCGCFPFR